MGFDILKVKIYILPGGRMPERQSEGAIGYDAFIRVIVSPFVMNPSNPVFRETLFDFSKMPDDKEMASHVRENNDKSGLVYVLQPGERVLIGIGFVTEMPFPYFYWVVPRSGLASKYGITVGNAPGTVDPDYRGEAGVILVNNSKKDFILEYGMRIVQIVFQKAEIPEIVEVKKYEELSGTERGAGGFGSTGM